MRKKQKITLLLITLFLLTCVPAFAEEAERAEVFVNSNALNSTITLESSGESVSGPGNKVYALIPTDSTFNIVAEPAEGSELMALTMKSDDGEVVETVEPIAQDGNVYTFRSGPTGNHKLTGEAYFGDPAEEDAEAARVAAEEAASNKIAAEKALLGEAGQKQATVDSEESPQSASDDEDAVQAETPVLMADTSESTPADNGAPQSAKTSGISEVPDTGVEDMDMIPLLLFVLILSGTVLVLRRKEA